MENTSNILTIKEVAEILRCSKGHVQNVLVGRVRGVPKLAHLRMGRRKVVRKEWLDQWMEAHKTSLVLHHVGMQRFGRKKESFSCVETDFKKEASVLANTAATRFGWPNGGKAGKKSRRCLGDAPTCRRAKPRR